MSEKWKQKILLIFPFAVLAAGMILTAAFFLHTYRQIAFEHTSALCETILANSPEAEPQLLAALKDYHSLTEQELRGNDYLEKYGYRVDDFCYDFPLDTVLFLILFFLVTACAFAAGIFLAQYLLPGGWLLSGARYDMDRASALILDEFRAGKVGKISLESPEV